MTVKELVDSLAGVPLDATVEIAVWDDGCCGGDDCGAQMSDTDIGSVSYDAVTNKVTLTEV